MTKELSKSDYEAQRVKLQGGISLALNALSTASFQESTGHGSAAATAKARAHHKALEDQLNSLDLAWKVQKDLDGKRSAQRRTAAWRAAIDTVEELLAKQKLAEETIARAVEALAAAYHDHVGAAEQMKETLKPFFHAAGPDGLERYRTMAEKVSPNVPAIRFEIAGALALREVDLSGVNAKAARDRIRDKGIFSHTAHREKQVRDVLASNTAD